MCGDQAYRTSNEELVLAVSLELAAAKWKVALHDGRRDRPAVHTVAEPHAAARLQGLSPRSTLGRGYAIVRADGVALRDTAACAAGGVVEIELASGELTATIEEVRP